MGDVSIVASIEELRRAWARVRFDHRNYRFVDHPHLLDWVEQDLDGWLTEVQEQLAAGFQPSPSQMCWALKSRHLLRPGCVLELQDEVVYNVLVGRMFSGIHARLIDLQGDPDVAYQIAPKVDDVDWTKSSFRLWKQWRVLSAQRLEHGASYVLVTDITGFYDNVDIRRLSSDVRRVFDSQDEIRLLTECLNAWAHPRGRGIPQGYSASHLLAKLFLEPVDRDLLNAGFGHLRYVDDFRIFVHSKLEAREAIARLTALLHRRGLSMQSAKTKVLDKAEATVMVDGVAVIIRDIAETLMAEIGEAEGIDVDYLPIWEIDKFLEASEGPPPEVLERAFGEHFVDPGAEGFDKTLFRFLLTRLGKVESRVAVAYCIDSLRSHPEETAYILRYFAKVRLADAELERVTTFAASAEAGMYDHQLYQIVRWFYCEGMSNEQMLALCRLWVFDHNRPIWLRSYCIAYLGAWGDDSDLENLDAAASGESAMGRADIVAAISRMEVSRRNTTYGRLGGEGGLTARAVRAAKAAG